MNLADCGDGVWVGNLGACDAHHEGRLEHAFPLVIHIVRPRRRDEGFLKWPGDCWAVCCPEPTGYVSYRHEHTPLAGEIDRLVRYMRRPGNLLVHCTAGLVRGPTLALLARVARGADPMPALVEVSRAMMAGYDSPMSPLVGPAAFGDIVSFHQVFGESLRDGTFDLLWGDRPIAPYVWRHPGPHRDNVGTDAADSGQPTFEAEEA